jgi:hypothetical protein
MTLEFKPLIGKLTKDNLKYHEFLPNPKNLSLHQHNPNTQNPDGDLTQNTKDSLKAAITTALNKNPTIQVAEEQGLIKVENEDSNKAISQIWQLIKSQSLFKIAALLMTNLAQLLNRRSEQLKYLVQPAVQELHKGLPDASWQALKQAYSAYESYVDKAYNGENKNPNPLASGALETDFA